VQVDPQLLLHRRLVLDHQDGGTEDFGGPVDLEAGREWREPNVAATRLSAHPGAHGWVFQVLRYMIINKN
jgi:hypothetical protein